jgi:hypothetical protein
MNPGLDVHGSNPFNPPLTNLPALGLVDYIVSARLFNLFLNYMCIPGFPDHDIMTTVVTENPWSRPITVWGYDDTFPLFGGDLHPTPPFHHFLLD